MDKDMILNRQFNDITCNACTARTNLWIVGKVSRHNPREWEFVGVFESQKKAESLCTNVHFFVGPAKLNEIVSNERVEWPDAYYPIPPRREAGYFEGGE